MPKKTSKAVKIQASAPPETTLGTPEIDISHKEIFDGIFNPAEPSNFKIKLKSEKFDVHKEVLGKHSEFFDKAGNGPFKKAATGKIHLSDDDPDAVKAMLQFCYTSEYTLGTAMHAEIYALAEKYNMTELKAIAITNFDKVAELELESAFFPAIIGYVYNSTPSKIADSGTLSSRSSQST